VTAWPWGAAVIVFVEGGCWFVEVPDFVADPTDDVAVEIFDFFAG
jgi:hypothetical protein